MKYETFDVVTLPKHTPPSCRRKIHGGHCYERMMGFPWLSRNTQCVCVCPTVAFLSRVGISRLLHAVSASRLVCDHHLTIAWFWFELWFTNLQSCDCVVCTGCILPIEMVHPFQSTSQTIVIVKKCFVCSSDAMYMYILYSIVAHLHCRVWHGSVHIASNKANIKLWQHNPLLLASVKLILHALMDTYNVECTHVIYKYMYTACACMLYQ